MKYMLIDTRDDHFRVAVKEDGKVILRRDVQELHEANGILIKEQGIVDVFVKEGFRSREVFSACRRFQWTVVRDRCGGLDDLFVFGRRGDLATEKTGGFGLADEIEEATKLP